MPEQNNDSDRLEQFFRKAAARADVSFNEDDWKKLEAQLDAADVDKAAIKKTKHWVSASVVIGSILLLSTATWVSYRHDFGSVNKLAISDTRPAETTVDNDEEARTAVADRQEEAAPPGHEQAPVRDMSRANRGALATQATVDATGAIEDESGAAPDEEVTSGDPAAEKINTGDLNAKLLADIPHEQIGRDLMAESPGVTERYKQKAVVQLPGAEEEDLREAQAVVQEEHASDRKKHVATPRLSLLLSYAPDFSGTSMELYSPPGKAFGAVLNYHFLNRWNISAGVIKNQKQYTGAGEDYKPPTGYWKYYTNGIIPETIDGSCSLLEFPLMVQYTIFSGAKSRWNVGVGASSYLMQSESYRYYFDQPNPGAKNGWNSRGSSRFLFNMANFTVSYERQMLPGLMLGIEPYAKIPLEEIGWSNLKLFSAGASVTVRYMILRKKSLLIPTRSRGPD